MLEALLARGSLILIFVGLVATGLGVPIPEDVLLLAAGALVHRRLAELWVALAACMLGVLLGDLLLFTAARRLGPVALERDFFKRLLPSDRRERIEKLYERHGGLLVFAGRHVAGLRAPVFAMAGIQQMSPLRFLIWDSLAAAISVPILLGLGYLFSDHIDRVRQGLARFEHYVLLVVVTAGVAYLVVRALRGRNRDGRSAAELQ